MPSKIEWTDKTWNPVTGCEKVSPGCANCYAEPMAKRLRGRFGYPADDPFRVTVHDGSGNTRDRFSEPLRWDKPRNIFLCSMSDLFHQDVPSDVIGDVFDTMTRCPQHRFQVLTKRPTRMMWDLDAVQVTPNVWLGVSAENQEWLEKRVPPLLELAEDGWKTFLSLEPLLGPIVLPAGWKGTRKMPDGLRYSWAKPMVDGVIVGGESGPGARPMHPDWVRGVRDQCARANVPFFFKQWGAWVPNAEGTGPRWVEDMPLEAVQEVLPSYYAIRVGKGKAGRLLDGRTHDELPWRV
jgi:protein gp37